MKKGRFKKGTRSRAKKKKKSVKTRSRMAETPTKTEVEEEVGVQKWLHNLVPDHTGEDDQGMDMGILDEEDQYPDMDDMARDDIKCKSTDEHESSDTTASLEPPPAPPMPALNVYLEAASNAAVHLASSGASAHSVSNKDSTLTVKLAPSASNEPSDPQLKELYSLNKIARAKKSVAILGGGVNSSVSVTGSFFNVGDSRANSVKLHCEVSGNTTKTLSFEPKNMRCCLCNESMGHRVLSRLGGKGESHRLVFALADQGFPAALPASGGGLHQNH